MQVQQLDQTAKTIDALLQNIQGYVDYDESKVCCEILLICFCNVDMVI